MFSVIGTSDDGGFVADCSTVVGSTMIGDSAVDVGEPAHPTNIARRINLILMRNMVTPVSKTVFFGPIFYSSTCLDNLYTVNANLMCNG